VIRALLRGEEVSHDGLIRVDRAKLWSLPTRTPALFGAAVSEQTARRVGDWADGLITVNQPTSILRRVIDAFRDGGGADKPVAVQVHLSWAHDDATALAIAHDQWRNCVFGPEISWNLESPEQFDEASRWVRPDDVATGVLVSSDTKRHIEWLREIADLGADQLFLHQVGRGAEQERFVEVFADLVLPEISS
jgi:alkanesulfonate monooxygenase SsuD/methylene tetrahydromethanopterin reductase-like flavin-dependent oxidoreductase (luciferase family)